jgi:hypothetical protein
MLQGFFSCCQTIMPQEKAACKIWTLSSPLTWGGKNALQLALRALKESAYSMGFIT